MIGRQISPSDREIIAELKSYWGNKIKLDFDMLNEPCVFFKYNSSPFEIVYKLSSTGTYLQKRWHYVQQAHKAILALCESKYKQEQLKAQSDFLKDQQHKDFMIQREKFKKEGFKDDLPNS